MTTVVQEVLGVLAPFIVVLGVLQPLQSAHEGGPVAGAIGVSAQVQGR